MFNVGDKVKIIWSEKYTAAEVFIYDAVTIERQHVDYPRSKYWHVISDTKARFCVKEEWLELVKDNTMKLTLPNGMTIEGTEQQIKETASILGYRTLPSDGNWYFSESKQSWIEISTMDANHVRNAMLKMYRTWAESLSQMQPKALLEALQSGCSDKTFLALLRRYVTLVK